VLTLLTKYLLHYKRVSIPGIGSFVIEPQPAELNFIDRLIHPPYYRILFDDNGLVDEDLVTFIGSSNNLDVASARQQLESFGNTLKRKVQEAPFTWNGIGKLEYTNGVIFHPEKIETGLQPVAANKIIRDNVQHTVLVGDQEVQSGYTEPFVTDTVARKPRRLLVFGWILLSLAVLFIGYHFYKYRFTLHSTGLQTKVVTNTAPVTHH
jgi:hypothetical protein